MCISGTGNLPNSEARDGQTRGHLRIKMARQASAKCKYMMKGGIVKAPIKVIGDASDGVAGLLETLLQALVNMFGL